MTSVWKVKVYTITYDTVFTDIEEVEFLDPTYTIEDNNLEIRTLFKYGYTFLGWKEDNNEDIIKNFNIPKGSTGDKHLTAVWEPIDYIVTRYVDGTSELIHYNIESPNYTLLNPNIKGLTFMGWTNCTKDEEGEEILYNPATIIKGETYGNITYIARFEPTIYSIEYKSTVGNAVTENQDTYSLAVESFELSDPEEKEGYLFIGWTEQDVEEGSPIEGLEKTTQIDTTRAENITLTALWEQLKKITFTSEKSYDMAPIYIKTGELLTEPIPLEKIGYTFTHWNNIEETEVFDFNTPITDHIVLYANYTFNSPELSFSWMGETESGYSGYDFKIDRTKYNLDSTLETDVYGITGWKLFDEANDQVIDTMSITKIDVENYISYDVLKAETKSFYAKAYIDAEEGTIYSEKSNVVKIHLPIDEFTPSLYIDGLGTDEDGEHFLLKISTSNTLDNWSVFGWDLFLKTDGEPELIKTFNSTDPDTAEYDAVINEGESKTFYAKVYKIEEGKKVYSLESNRITLPLSE